jgi:hypothetical protein
MAMSTPQVIHRKSQASLGAPSKVVLGHLGLKQGKEWTCSQASLSKDRLDEPNASQLRHVTLLNGSATPAASTCGLREARQSATGSMQPGNIASKSTHQLAKSQQETPVQRARKRLRDIVNGVVDSDGQDSDDSIKKVMAAKKPLRVVQHVGPNVLSGEDNDSKYKRARLRNPDAMRLSAPSGAKVFLCAYYHFPCKSYDERNTKCTTLLKNLVLVCFWSGQPFLGFLLKLSRRYL